MLIYYSVLNRVVVYGPGLEKPMVGVPTFFGIRTHVDGRLDVRVLSHCGIEEEVSKSFLYTINLNMLLKKLFFLNETKLLTPVMSFD